jgi:hypothetical protein
MSTDLVPAIFRVGGATNSRDTTIWLSLGNTAFPSAGWHDFPVVILAWWAEEVADLLRGDRRCAQLRFMEGPYVVVVSDGPGGEANVRLVRQLRTGEVVLREGCVPAEEIGREIHRGGTAVLGTANPRVSDDARVLRASLDRLAAVLGERGRR